ncbi:hypothetical protein BVI2075_270020 [Burkholderia vietnamiensis]|nr:hypothetical protein BVI2075_270020 [Burkholderia vietnamiensis]
MTQPADAPPHGGRPCASETERTHRLCADAILHYHRATFALALAAGAPCHASLPAHRCSSSSSSPACGPVSRTPSRAAVRSSRYRR